MGPSGSGKSTLLRAMLGEVEHRGSISLGIDNIGYCPQVPWVFTGTIRQNICGLGPGPVDEDWYKSVIDSCLLGPFFHTLPRGDTTWIEGQSSSLSGGQRQRIVLARILYQRPQLLLLDDILSALDIKTEVQIMNCLFGESGLLSKHQATVIMVTHSRRWETIADNVITLDGAGSMTQYSNSRRCEVAISADLTSVDDPIPGSDAADDFKAERTDNNSSPTETPKAWDPSLRKGGDYGDYTFYFRTMQWP